MRLIFATISILPAASCALLMIASPAGAQTRTWDANGASPPNGTFNVANNWNPDQVPIAGNTALFDIADTYTVTFTGNEASDVVEVADGTVSFLSDSTTVRTYDLLTGAADLVVRGGILNVGAAGAPIDLNVGDQVNIGDTTASGTVTVSGAFSTLTQSGVSSLNVGSSSGGAGTLNVTSSGMFTTGTGTTTVNATGTINLSNNGSAFNANGNVVIDGGSFIRNLGTFNWADNQTMTISGGGTFEWGGTNANLTLSAANAQIDVTGGGSIFRQSDSLGDSTVFIQNGVSLDADLGGTIEAEFLFIDDGSVTVDGLGSTLDVTTGTASFLVHRIGSGSGAVGSLTLSNDASGSFAAVTPVFLRLGVSSSSTATVVVMSGADLTLHSLDMDEDGTSTVTVDGGGSTITQQGASMLLVGSSSGSTGTIDVTNGGTFTTGTGATTVNATGAINISTGGTGGTFDANGSMTIDGGSLTIGNTGNVTVTTTTQLSNAGTLTINGGTFNANGAMTVGGAVNLAGGEMTAGTVTLDGGGAFNFTGGVLHVAEFVGNLNNQGGTLAPGNTPGITNVTGDYTNQSSATVEIEIATAGGVAGTDFDQVTISEAANLDGSLFADMGFAPAHEESFVVMTFASRSGVFMGTNSAVTDSGLPGMLVMAPYYTATDVTLRVKLLGDASPILNPDGTANLANGRVDAGDYTAWANGFGMAEPSYGDGDFSRNGIVNAGDYTIWANTFGNMVPVQILASGPAAVPEPSAWVLAALGLIGLLGYGRQRRRRPSA